MGSRGDQERKNPGDQIKEEKTIAQGESISNPTETSKKKVRGPLKRFERGKKTGTTKTTRRRS